MPSRLVCSHWIPRSFKLNAYHMQRKTDMQYTNTHTHTQTTVAQHWHSFFTNQAVALKSDHVTAHHFYWYYSFLHDSFLPVNPLRNTKQVDSFWDLTLTLSISFTVLTPFKATVENLLHEHPVNYYLCNWGQFYIINSNVTFWRVCHRKFVGVLLPKIPRFTLRLNPRSSQIIHTV